MTLVPSACEHHEARNVGWRAQHPGLYSAARDIDASLRLTSAEEAKRTELVKEGCPPKP